MEKKGFTLIELLAVIIILGILMLVAIPSVSTMIYNSRVRSYVKSVDTVVSAATIKKVDDIPDQISVLYTVNNGVKELDYRGKLDGNGMIIINSIGKSNVAIYNSNLRICIMKDYVETEYRTTKSTREECIDYEEISTVEDLVELGQYVDGGEETKDKKYLLINSINFNDDNSYVDPNSTTYGDINGDGVVKSIKEEVTSGRGFNPIGYVTLAPGTSTWTSDIKRFEGIFDGMGNRISNLYINREDANQALFAVTNGKIRNLVVTGNTKGAISGYAYESALVVGRLETNGQIDNVNVSGTVTGNSYSGGIIGKADSNTKITSSNSTVNIVTSTGASNFGGIVGGAEGSIIENCIAELKMTGEFSQVGGIAGIATNTKISKSKAKFDVSGTGTSKLLGGIVGRLVSSTIEDSSANSTIKASAAVGGLAGVAYTDSAIKNSHATANIKIMYSSSTLGYVGGLVGQTMTSNLLDSYANVNITVDAALGDSELKFVGGLLGCGLEASKIINSYAKGDIVLNRGRHAGGLAGLTVDYVSNSYSEVNLNTNFDQEVGGIIGYLGNTNQDYSILKVKNVYATGNVSGTFEVGGLIGQNADGDRDAPGRNGGADSIKYVLIEKGYALGNIKGESSIGGLIGNSIMNADSLLFAGKIVDTPSNVNTIGRAVGWWENVSTAGEYAKYTNLYYKNNIEFSGGEFNKLDTKEVSGLAGVAVSTLKNSNWFKTTLGLDNNWEYRDGYYPLLRAVDEAGNPTNKLVPGQVWIEIK